MSDFTNKTFSVAPMMAWTTRHCRAFHRQITQKAILYTEMVTTGAIIYGEYDRYLQFSDLEHPIALQIGGGDPLDLAKSVKITNQYNYDEINLNVGCPSDRVQKGKIGAVLMAEPNLVADCFKAMQGETDKKVTIKNRLSIDDMAEETVFNFVETVANAGCKTFIIHARKAFLKGLDPKKNRDIPPLRYDLVYQVKEKFPELEIIINGGIKTIEQCKQHYEFVDGVMMGREAYQNPWVMSKIDEMLGGEINTKSRQDIIEQMVGYIDLEISKGNHIKHIARHWMGLFHGQRNAKAFKQHINDNIKNRNDIDIIYEALAKLESHKS